MIEQLKQLQDLGLLGRVRELAGEGFRLVLAPEPGAPPDEVSDEEKARVIEDTLYAAS